MDGSIATSPIIDLIKDVLHVDRACLFRALAGSVVVWIKGNCMLRQSIGTRETMEEDDNGSIVARGRSTEMDI
jgi:hypothetical protein